MKKILASMAAFGLMIVGSTAMADPTPPSFVQLHTVTLGHAVGNLVPISYQGKTQMFGVVNCEVSWTDNEEFYVLTTGTTQFPLLIKKTLFDYVWNVTRDWDTSLKALQKDNDLCIVVPPKAAD